MALYRCVLLGARNNLRIGEMIESPTLAGAVRQGRRMIAHRPHYDSFEIWEEQRRLHAEIIEELPHRSAEHLATQETHL